MERDIDLLRIEKIRSAVREVLSAGYQLSPDAVEVLKEALDPQQVVKLAIEKAEKASPKLNALSAELLKAVIRELEGITPKVTFRPYASEVEEEVEIVKDPTTQLSTEGTESGFLRYFRSRLEKLQSLLRERMDVADVLSISEALRKSVGSTVKFVGLVFEKVERRGRIRLLLDDLEEEATVVFKTGVGPGYEKARQLLVDQVVCIQATRYPAYFLGNDVVWPDVPLKARRKEAEEPIYAALTSDLHVGSKQFLEELFHRFLQWLRGRYGSHVERRIAGRVKYVVIAGDLVDGLGVYPGQEEDLLIADVGEQYDYVGRLLEEVPEYVRVIVIPGNHDAVRQALPQPAIPSKYAKQLYSNDSITMLGNPAHVKLHGASLLLYHGRSLEDIISSVRGLSYSRPEDAMCLLLRGRHLAPMYGASTPIAPELEDMLVIEDTPDVLHCGHMHVNGYKSYRGVKVVNSGTWQATTSYQLKRGITPTPGKLPVLDLCTLEMIEIDFKSSLAA